MNMQRFSAVSRVAMAGSSGAASEASAHKIPTSESLKVLGNFQKPTAAFVQMSEEPFAPVFGVLQFFMKREVWFRPLERLRGKVQCFTQGHFSRRRIEPT